MISQVLARGDAEASDVGRLRRVSAVLLSLAAPGAGHVLLGAFRRGIAWVAGLLILKLLFLFAAPLSLWLLILLGGGVIGLLGPVGAAIDAARIIWPRPSWKIVIFAWTALLAGDLVVGWPLAAYYRAQYAQAFTIPSGAMQPTLLPGDYIMVDKSVYRSQAPRRGDIVVFQYPPDERRDFIKRIIGVPGDVVAVRGQQVLVNGRKLVEPYLKDTTTASTSQSDHCGYLYACEPTRVPADSYFVLGDAATTRKIARTGASLGARRSRGGRAWS